ncbi:hypothetical protein [Vulcaniibacterium gelatinicum]|uniref:hypothetical protein n=1 Tax=Vulcaniibacterium gelatinicum TaxID=2598725 RepID=UPI0011CB3148|nr:hypothetical protein [Vulcaniibacterium gelatinicum]
MRGWIWVVLLSWLVAGTLQAGKLDEVRRQVESSRLVTGTIDITADGSVLGHALDDPDRLPQGVRALIAQTVPAWRFAPVQLEPGTSRGRARMSLRLVARKDADGNYRVGIVNAHFGNPARPGERVESLRVTPPRYPPTALAWGVGGTASVVLKVGRDGLVEDALVEQVNLRAIASEKDMANFRDMLAGAALRGARRWQFQPPTRGNETDAPFWSVRVPVTFVAPGQQQPKDTEWHSYVPGPRQPIPWEPAQPADGPDALASDSIHPLDRSGPRLLTPLGDS